MSSRSASRPVWTCLALAGIAFLFCSRAAFAQGAPGTLLEGRGALQPRPSPDPAAGAATAAECTIPGGRIARWPCLRPVTHGTAASAVQAVPAVLTLREAIHRAVEHNLTILGLTHAVSQERGQQRVARSRLLPNITGEFSALEQRLNLAAVGVQIEIPIPGVEVARVVGPFNVLDWRARLSQSLVNVTALQSHRASGEAVRASELSLRDARDLITLAVGRTYLETLAGRARVEATRTEVDTATALHERAVQQQAAGLATPLDVNRAHVQALTARQRLASLEGGFAKQKIDLVRMTGLPPTDQFDLDDAMPYAAAPPVSVDDMVRQALETRADLMAADAQVRAAELTLSSVRAERLPSVELTADYGASRAFGTPATNTYMVAGVVRVPLWDAGRTSGQVEQAIAMLNRRRAERDDLRAQIEADVRKAYVDLHASTLAVEVAELNLQINRDTLGLTRQRFDAGVSDNVALVQSQESLASAEFAYIDSVLGHNLAKLELARARGRTAENIDRLLLPPGS
jgi:outer membrane protein TolC